MDQQQYNYQPMQPQLAPQPNLLVFGILSLALTSLFGIFSIIFGAIGRSKGNNYIRQGGTLTGPSKVGYILSLVGLILGIVSLVVIVIVIVIAVATDSNVFQVYLE